MNSVRGTIDELHAVRVALDDPLLARMLKKALGRTEFSEMAAAFRAGEGDAGCGPALDALSDWFGGGAPALVEFEAMGSSAGAYPVTVSGTPALCIVFAPDFGRYGYFPSVDAACDYVLSAWESASEVWRSSNSHALARAADIQAKRQQSKGSGKAHFAQGNPLAKMHEGLMKELRASGRTVTVVEPSDMTEFVVTFPQGKRPTSARRRGAQKTEDD